MRSTEHVAKRVLNHCLNDWKRHAINFHQENPDVAAEQVRKHIKWYMPLVHFSAQAYFDYWNSMDLAQLWDSMTAGERGEWIVAQLRTCVDCLEGAEEALAYFAVAEKPTYGRLVAELVKDVEGGYVDGGGWLREKSA